MALSKETRIIIFIVIDVIFFLLEITVGYVAHSLALVADAFHMLNDVISLFVGLWAVRVATRRASSNRYTYGWARAELLGGFVNGVFLIALCLTIVLDAIQRFFEPQEVDNPQLVFAIGAIGLAFNVLGLFVFGHGHDHGHEHGEEEHAHTHEDGHQHVDELDAAEHGHHGHKHDADTAGDSALAIADVAERSKSDSIPQDISSPRKSIPRVSWDNSLGHRTSADSHNRQSFSGRSHSRQRSRSIDRIPTHPASLRVEFQSQARRGDVETDDEDLADGASVASDADPSEEAAQATEVTKLLSNGHSRRFSSASHKTHPKSKQDSTGVHFHHHDHRHTKSQGKKKGGHSHDDMNIRGIFLHVLGDALGNVGVMAAALIIWLTTWSFKNYFDPAISLLITLIILKSAIPLCLDTARPLLQAVPGHVDIDDIKADIESFQGVRSCHHVHVWALTPSKLIATLDIELDFDFEGANAQKYMELATEIKKCLKEYGITSSTVQPEFRTSPAAERAAHGHSHGHARHGSSSTVQTAIADRTYGSIATGDGPADSAQGNPTCLLDADSQCCAPPEGANKNPDDHSPHSHSNGHRAGIFRKVQKCFIKDGTASSA